MRRREGDGWLHEFSDLSGLSVSEDENHVFVEAALPGLKADEIEMTFDKGILWIKAEKKEEKAMAPRSTTAKRPALFLIAWPFPELSMKIGIPKLCSRTG